jgi:hypothetical protein
VNDDRRVLVLEMRKEQREWSSPCPRGCCRIRGAYSEGRFQERKKLTMVKTQAYWKAGKTKKSAMLDNFCESMGYCRRYAARVLHQAGQRSLLGETILVADSTKHIHRHRPPRYGPLVQQALITIWAASTFLGPVQLAGGMPPPRRTSPPMGISKWRRRHGVSSSR